MVPRLIESMTMVTTKIEERGEVVSCPLVSRFAFVSWGGVGSQFPHIGSSGPRVFPTVDCTIYRYVSYVLCDVVYAFQT
jgi:hypothetical protein